MSFRTKIIVYLVAIHALLGAVAVLALHERPLWLLGAEILFAVSITLGILLIRSFFVPLRLIRTGAELVAEQDFTSTFRPVGQAEMDELIRVYNRMIERLRSERLRVEEQNRFLADLLEAAPVGVITLDFDGRIASVNPAAAELIGSLSNGLGGSGRPDGPGQPSSTEEPDDSAGSGGLPGVDETVEMARPNGPSRSDGSGGSDGAGRPTRSDTLAGRTPDRLAAPLGPVLAALPAGSSQVVADGPRRLKCSRAAFYERGFARTFFLLEELTEEIRQTERNAYETLIRLMSHEVNNSVGAVGSLLETLGDYGAALDDPDRERFTRALTVAVARLGRLRSFVSGYADVVRLPPPDRRPCDLAELLDEILILLAPELEHRRITWTWTDRAQIPPIPLDRNQIEQVLVNVLKNAAEAIGENGTIELALTSEPRDGRQTPTLTIRDTGPGLTPETQEHLFSPFFSTKRDGRGLGLTLAHEVLTRHGFEHSLRNRPEGGAELVIRF